MEQFMAKNIDLVALDDMGLDGSKIIPLGRSIDADIAKIRGDNTLTADAKTLKSYRIGKKHADMIAVHLSANVAKLSGEIEALSAQKQSSILREKEINGIQAQLIPSVLQRYDSTKEMSDNGSKQRMLLALEDHGMLSGISGVIDARYSGPVLEAIASKEESIDTAIRLMKNVQEYPLIDLKEAHALEISGRQVG